MVRIHWNSDKILSISAISISLMTLMVLMYQTSLLREQQLQSVLPYLSVNNHGGETPHYKMVLTNNGIGPAFVESVFTGKKGDLKPVDIPSYMYKYNKGMDSLSNVFHSNLFPGQMIPAGSTIEIFSVENSLKDARLLTRLLRQNDLEFELRYRSIYGETWVYKSTEGAPVKLE